MAVYVDPLLPYERMVARTGHLFWCHLTADSREELHAFAAQLGVPRRAFQDHPVRWHYDLPASARDQAVRAGAAQVGRRQLGLLLRARRAALGGPVG